MSFDYTRFSETVNRDIIDELRDLIDELAAPHAPDVKRTMRAAATIGMPAKSSGTGSTPSNSTDEEGTVQPDNQVEAAALHPDQAAIAAQEHIAKMTELYSTPRIWRAILRAYAPNRPVAGCPRCGHPFDRTSTRCQQRDDSGRLCGSSGEHSTICANTHCGKDLKVGEIRDGRCPGCYRFKREHGRDRIPQAGLDLGDTLIVNGVAHG